MENKENPVGIILNAACEPGSNITIGKLVNILYYNNQRLLMEIIPHLQGKIGTNLHVYPKQDEM